ncbi:MAG TPA: carbohydrate kinase [Methylophaga sp.]|nr:carbohydrate kinase [Methylophaga sp.]
MTESARLAVFGEALFDCFADQQKLGGAPFNVAWHLQAFGDAPQFISRVGDDALGQQIKNAMQQWGMDLTALQTDTNRPTGTVNVSLKGSEPHYEISDNAAYDYIDKAMLPALRNDVIVYHGSLALRHSNNHEVLAHLVNAPSVSVFVDVNLRAPWWEKESLFASLERARWVKLNADELAELGFQSADLLQDMIRMQTNFQLEQLIVTRGEQGAIVRCNDGQVYEFPPSTADKVADTVGAGDAFSAMYLHGLLHGWPVTQILPKAQAFAAAVVGLQGAFTDDVTFYQPFSQ